MNCSQISKYFPDYLTGNLNASIKPKFEEHLSDCFSCKEEMTSMSKIWSKLESLPEEHPSPALRVRFNGMLEAFEAGQQQTQSTDNWFMSWIKWLGQLGQMQPAIQLGFAVLLLVFGLLIGYKIHPAAPENNDLTLLRQEVDDLSKLVTISLLQQKSPTERLRGVNYSHYVEQPDREVLSALLKTLNYDSNTNVRLEAVDALSPFFDRNLVGQGLIESLTIQNSPLIQIALIDLFVERKEKQSLKVLNQILEKQKIHQTVKIRAKRAIEQLQ